jgi:hypothetical protein
MRTRVRVFVIARSGETGQVELFNRDGVVPVFYLSATALEAASHLVDDARDGKGWVVCASELNTSIQSAVPITKAGA